MAYTPIPAKPGVAGTTLPGANVNVYYITLQTMGTIRIEADVVKGTAAVDLELHLFTYPATSYTIKQTFIQAVLPVGTHYVAARSQVAGVQYLLWRNRITQCPSGCVAAAHMAGTIREMVANFHARAGLPPPTEEEVRAITPPHIAHLLDPHPAGLAPEASRRLMPPVKTKSQPVRPLMPDGPVVRVVLTAAANEAQFSSDIIAPGNYEFKVGPPPVAEQDLYFLNLIDDRGRTIQSSSDGSLMATLSARIWRLSLVLPRNLLRTPRTLAVSLTKKDLPPQRPGLDNPPDGDASLLANNAVAVDVEDTRPKAQCYVDIAEAATWKFTCVEITGGAGSPQADAPATMTLYDSAGVLTSGPTAPGVSFTASLSPGRWWVDLAVPDFRGRTTPRRYAVGVAKVSTA